MLTTNWSILLTDLIYSADTQVALVYGQMNEPPGARARVALTGLTVAEYFRDQEGQDVLLFIDNIFRFTQAGSEVRLHDYPPNKKDFPKILGLIELLYICSVESCTFVLYQNQMDLPYMIFSKSCYMLFIQKYSIHV